MEDPRKNGQRLCEVGKGYSPSHGVKKKKKKIETKKNRGNILYGVTCIYEYFVIQFIRKFIIKYLSNQQNK